MHDLRMRRALLVPSSILLGLPALTAVSLRAWSGAMVYSFLLVTSLIVHLRPEEQMRARHLVDYGAIALWFSYNARLTLASIAQRAADWAFLTSCACGMIVVGCYAVAVRLPYASALRVLIHALMHSAASGGTCLLLLSHLRLSATSR